MSYFCNGTAQYLSSAASLAALQNTSFTLAIWLRVADATPSTTQTAFSIGSSSTSSDRYCQLQLSTGGFGTVQAYQSTSATSSTTDGAADAVNNTWFLVVGRFTLNSSHQVTELLAATFNGTAETTDPTPTTGLTKQMNNPFNVIRVGASRSSTSAFAGYVAHAAIWTRLLTNEEVTSLTTNAPNLVAASDLYVYWPLLTGLAETAQGGGTFDLTNNSATLNTDDGPSITLSGGTPAPSISDAGDEAYYNGESITITGSNFGASAGTVLICPTDDVDDTNAIAQTVTNWAGTGDSVTITTRQLGLNLNTDYYLFVVTSDDVANTAGYVIRFVPRAPIVPRTRLVSQSATLAGSN